MNHSHITPRVAIAPTTSTTALRPSRAGRLVRTAAAVVAASTLLVGGEWGSGVDAASARATASTTKAATPAKQSSTESLLRHILKSHYNEGEFVGARIAALESDGRITEASAGTTTVQRSSGPVDPDVPWNIGSATKSFVAVVVLQLAEAGEIDLDAGIDTYMPDLPGADRITPRQLLQHTSGLAEYINEPVVLNDRTREWLPGELIAIAEAVGRVGQPGGAYSYANTNFIIVGEIIKQVTGNGWSDEVRTRIVEPLGLTDTFEMTFGMTSERPIGYAVVDDVLVERTFWANPSTGGAAGALMGTTRDLLLFGKALRDGTLLSPASQAAMQTFVPGEDYSQFGIAHSSGLGLQRYATRDITINGHMGTGDAQSAFYGWDPEHDTVVAVTTNVAVTGPQAFMTLEALRDIRDAG